MFTGLVEETGRIGTVRKIPEGREFSIKALNVLDDLENGDSISVDGACLSVIKKDKNGFSVQAVEETLTKTTLKSLKSGAHVNLERAMLGTSRFGGHIVQGHIDGTGKIIKRIDKGQNALFSVELPSELTRYVVSKGSIALNGVSLTVASIEKNTITVSLIPHTLNETTFSEKRTGNLLNIEVDILAKYVEKSFKQDRAGYGGMEKNLSTWGYKK